MELIVDDGTLIAWTARIFQKNGRDEFILTIYLSEEEIYFMRFF